MGNERMCKVTDTKLVCNSCGADWPFEFNPGDCPNCKRSSHGIVVKGTEVESPVANALRPGAVGKSFWKKII